MEVITGSFHQVFPIDDASRIGEARRHAASLTAGLNWGATDAGRVALVINEFGTNLLRHAVRGKLLITARADQDEVEVLSIDHGPGMAELARSLRDGFSTGSTPGTGLGAIRRQSQDFDIHSSVPHGTVAVARFRRGPQRSLSPFIVGAVSIAAPHETVCGDGWTVCLNASEAAVMLADGLGHGPDADRAAQAALAVFRRDPFAALAVSLQDAHAELRTTRGAAVLSLRLDLTGATVRSAGAGNVVARLVSGVTDRSILSQHGTLGVQIRRTEEVSAEWPPHALLVAHTDGIETRWSKDLLMPLLDRDPALVAATLLRDHCRERDDATIVVIGRRN
jgi:anti-sigma regulatory factor (Ser/Thr protein kinase)